MGCLSFTACCRCRSLQDPNSVPIHRFTTLNKNSVGHVECAMLHPASKTQQMIDTLFHYAEMLGVCHIECAAAAAGVG